MTRIIDFGIGKLFFGITERSLGQSVMLILSYRFPVTDTLKIRVIRENP